MDHNNEPLHFRTTKPVVSRVLLVYTVISILCLVWLASCILDATAQDIPGVEPVFDGPYQVAGDYLAVEGDILVARTSDMHHDAIAKGLVTTDTTQYWPNGVIPYRIDPGMPAKIVENIERAMDHWMRVTPIGFIHWTGETNFVTFYYERNICASYIGMIGGEQPVLLEERCSYRSVSHEIGHVVGLGHEHTREDRGVFVTVLWDNIIEEAKSQFFRNTVFFDDHGPALDFDSIMMYRRTAFSRNGLPTILPLAPNQTKEFGIISSLSAGDVAAVEFMYPEKRVDQKQCESHDVTMNSAGMYWGKPNGEFRGWKEAPTGSTYTELTDVQGGPVALYLSIWRPIKGSDEGPGIGLGFWEFFDDPTEGEIEHMWDHQGEKGLYLWSVRAHGPATFTMCSIWE